MKCLVLHSWSLVKCCVSRNVIICGEWHCWILIVQSVDVMDYSLLVGVDDERKELVLGIIDFMRQYTWDKHLETWVKASGILGGPKNAAPTIVSPKQYKKRFRKAMTTYFLTLPDQWSLWFMMMPYSYEKCILSFFFLSHCIYWLVNKENLKVGRHI